MTGRRAPNATSTHAPSGTPAGHAGKHSSAPARPNAAVRVEERPARGASPPAASYFIGPRLKPRQESALAFIAVQNAHRRFPNAADVQRYLNLPYHGQGKRIVDQLKRLRCIVRTDRGLEVQVHR